MTCPFCEDKIIEDQKVSESDFCFLLCSIRPANFGQCIVVPKRHVGNIRELKEEELIDLILFVQKISAILNEKLSPSGINYGFNESEYAGQSVTHFHFHIMPRFQGDKEFLPEYHLFHRDPARKRNLDREELKSYVQRLKLLIK